MLTVCLGNSSRPGSFTPRLKSHPHPADQREHRAFTGSGGPAQSTVARSPRLRYRSPQSAQLSAGWPISGRQRL
jgi:hypothetical protein